MKIVRHVARDMRQGMRAIRERLGEDAVILSSRRVSEGVELTAAVDFDAEALATGQVQPVADLADSSAGHDGASTSYGAEATGRDVAPSRRATPPVRDDDEPVRSKVPPSFDDVLREQARISRTEVPVFHDGARTLRTGGATSRDDVHARDLPTLRRSEPRRLESDSPLISSDLQAALLDSLVVRTDSPPRTATPAATPPAASAAASAMAPQPTTSVSHEAAASQAAVVRVEHAVVDATRPLDLDLTELAEAPPRAQRPAVVSDSVGTELKALRRMLETQLAQLAWNDMTRRAPIHTEILRELSEIGIAQDLATQITQQLPPDTDLTYARRFCIAALSQYLLVTGDRWLDNGGRIAFIGATGVGKTMTLSKLAVRWVLRHGARELALVAADNVRLGAQEQMRSLGQLLGSPVYTPEKFETLPALLSRLPQRFILIDTPGSSLRDTQLSSRLAVLASSASQLQTALVLCASTQAGALEEVVKRFAPANPCCCVLTKVDEAASLGGALSVLVRARIPVSYVSEGQRVPEDLRPARALELVSNAVRLAKASGAAADEDLLRRRFGKIAHAIT